MWAVLSVPPVNLFQNPISACLSANSHRSRHRSSAKTTKKNQRGAVTNQLSGLDVLWAMQKAADEKNRVIGARSKRNRKRVESESGSLGQRDEYGVDYSNTRPLLIKDEWGPRLDELEKRLQELSQTK